jgi:hypothetical protein
MWYDMNAMKFMEKNTRLSLKPFSLLGIEGSQVLHIAGWDFKS